jgi:hypothetical protein
MITLKYTLCLDSVLLPFSYVVIVGQGYAEGSVGG